MAEELPASRAFDAEADELMRDSTRNINDLEQQQRELEAKEAELTNQEKQRVLE